jgi:hypothetical protein
MYLTEYLSSPVQLDIQSPEPRLLGAHASPQFWYEDRVYGLALSLRDPYWMVPKVVLAGVSSRSKRRCARNSIWLVGLTGVWKPKTNRHPDIGEA